MRRYTAVTGSAMTQEAWEGRISHFLVGGQVEKEARSNLTGIEFETSSHCGQIRRNRTKIPTLQRQ